VELAPRLRPWLRAYLSNPRNRLPQNQLDALLDAQLEDPVRYAVLLALAAGIATYGLIGDSSPVIIGAMIVSPLMSPILGLAYGLVRPDPGLRSRSLRWIVWGVLEVVLISFLLSNLSGYVAYRSEVLNRIEPCSLDLWVALISGAAGAFCTLNPQVASSLAGVAIAVALVPPLCVTGIGLAGLMDVVNHGNFLLSDLSWPVTSGSFLLFFTNLFGITVAAALVLRLYGYGRRTAMGRLFASLSLLLAAVVIPLWLNDASVFLQARVQKSLHVIERLYPAMEIKTVIAQPKHQPPQVEFVLGVPRQPTIDERRDMLRLVASILGRRVQASFSFVSRASS
jgi:uncharacterized hydrophobic protein (TIGR00271 family)